MNWFFLLPCILFASDSFFSSDHIAYKDRSIALKGHISIEHPLGKIRADEGEILDIDETSFTKAILKSNIEFFFKEDLLTASELIWDRTTNQVTAKGPIALVGTEKEFLLACDGIAEFTLESKKLIFTANHLPISFDKGDLHIRSQSTSLLFENNEPSAILFENDVHLINDTVHCSAQSLIYSIKESSLKGVGKVIFTLQSENGWK
ncbi:MAG: hypothetical protein FJZ64_01705, partial [Chlamydiae bacterium]|nr:hypothetical protein [Chlamydiota bacterium]